MRTSKLLTLHGPSLNISYTCDTLGPTSFKCLIADSPIIGPPYTAHWIFALL